MNQDERNNGLSGPTNTASIAENECHQGVTAVSDSVQKRISKPSTGAKSNGHNGGGVTFDVPFTNSKGNIQGFYIPSGYLRKCDICGREYTAKRHTSKYCGGACRQQAWLKNHPAMAEAKNTAHRERTKARVLASGGTWIDR